MASSGVPDLDRALGGGFPERSSILIEGPSSNEKEGLTYEFIRSGLRLNDFCIYVTRLSAAEVTADASAQGIDLDGGVFWMCPEHGDRSYASEDLASISFGVKNVLREHEGSRTRVVFDLPSQLLMTQSSDSVLRFLGQLLTDLKRYDATFVATVQQDMHPPEVLAGLELLFDGVLGVRRSANGAVEVKIKKMRGARLAESSASFRIGAVAEESTTPAPLRMERIAVLPFVNMSPDPNDEFFADGLTEELIDRLCQIRELEVIARTSVMAYKNKEKKAAEIGNELRVGSLVEGSVRKAGNKIRVTAQLIDVRTEGHLWSSRYDGELQDVFELQGDISEKITSALKLNLVDADRRKVERKATSIPEAHVAYLNGIYFRYKASLEGLRKAAEFSKRAIELDPGYAEAYAQLAIDYIFLGVFWGEPAPQAFSKASELANKALELGPELSEAHYAKSWVAYFYEMDWGAAERESRTALGLKPSYAEPRNCLVWVLLALGRNEEALGEARKAVDLDPLGVYSYQTVAHALSSLGRFDEAVVWHAKTLESEPDSPFFHTELGYVYLQMGKMAEGVEEMEKATKLAGGEFFSAALGYAYAVSGKKEEAYKVLSELKLARASGKAGPHDIAIVCAGLGENPMALDLLEQAYQERSIAQLLPLSVDPVFSSLRSEPRFKALLQKLNLTAE